MKFLKFRNPQNWGEWGDIEHPNYGKVTTYWPKGVPCYNTYSKPILHDDGEIEMLNFDQDEGCWDNDGSYWFDLEGEDLVNAIKYGV